MKAKAFEELDKRILSNNACYIDGWINAMRQEPKFIVSVMADVNKAAGTN